MTATPGTFGVRSMTAPLRSVALRTPTTVGDFDAAGWRPPDPALLLDQHERLAELLSGLGAEVVVLPPLDGMVDACFVFDPLLVTGAGAVVLRSAKAIRFAEAEPLVADLETLGVPEVGRVDGAALVPHQRGGPSPARRHPGGRGCRAGALRPAPRPGARARAPPAVGGLAGRRGAGRGVRAARARLAARGAAGADDPLGPGRHGGVRHARCQRAGGAARGGGDGRREPAD